MSCMIEELPSHETADNINCHNYFDRTIGRKLKHWQEHDLQLCIWIPTTNISENAKNRSRLKKNMQRGLANRLLQGESEIMVS